MNILHSGQDLFGPGPQSDRLETTQVPLDFALNGRATIECTLFGDELLLFFRLQDQYFESAEV